tara:strand:- start:3396 stop:4274 length:879 start_codon:yes stop_codon:yes gene_type:complete
MKTRILAFSGSKQSGKSTCCNFLHGYQLRCQAIVENFSITKDGGLVVRTQVLNENGEAEEGDAMLDVSRQDIEFAEWAAYSMWPFVKKYSFAAPLKDIAIGLFGLTEEQCYGNDKQKNTTTNIRWEDLPTATSRKKNKRKRMTAREFLQYFGTDVCRKIKKDIWVDCCIQNIHNEGPLLAIIDDCRFPNEIEAIQNAGGKIIRLTRSPHSDSHSSELSLDKYEDFDAVIDNQNLTIAEACKEIIDNLDSWGWLGKEISQSEINQKLAAQLGQQKEEKPQIVGGIHTIKKASE